MEKWLRNKTFVQIAAVLLAILLWVVVHLDGQVASVPSSLDAQTRSISDVQITIIGLNDEQFHVAFVDPSFVNIVLKGRESAVNQVRPNSGQSKIQLDLSSITEAGQHTINLTAIEFPRNVAVDIYPPSVTVLVEEIQNKEVPIMIEVIGEPSEGYRAGVPIANPSRAIVSAPESELEQITAVRTTVDISNAQEAVFAAGKLLVAINQDGVEVDAVISPALVDVDIPITSPFKTVPIQVSLVNQPPPGYSVVSFRQNVNEVTIYGPQEVLDTIEFYDGLQIDLSLYSSNQRLEIPIPLKDRLQQVTANVVVVNLEIVPSERRTIEDIPITLSGANEDFKTTFIDPESGLLDIIIEGAPSVLNTVNRDNLQAIIDVSNLPPGVYELTVRLNLPSNVKYGGTIEALQVRIEISIIVDEEDVISEVPLEQNGGVTS